jgi:hypothetical protein
VVVARGCSSVSTTLIEPSGLVVVQNRSHEGANDLARDEPAAVLPNRQIQGRRCAFRNKRNSAGIRLSVRTSS